MTEQEAQKEAFKRVPYSKKGFYAFEENSVFLAGFEIGHERGWADCLEWLMVSVLVEALGRTANTDPDDLQAFHDIANKALAKFGGKR